MADACDREISAGHGTSGGADSVISVNVPSTKQEGEVTVYRVETTFASGRSTIVHRRYKLFSELDENIRAEYKKTNKHLVSNIPQLPGKGFKLFKNHKDANFIEDRRYELNAYLNRLLSVPRAAHNGYLVKFCGGNYVAITSTVSPVSSPKSAASTSTASTASSSAASTPAASPTNANNSDLASSSSPPNNTLFFKISEKRELPPPPPKPELPHERQQREAGNDTQSGSQASSSSSTSASDSTSNDDSADTRSSNYGDNRARAAPESITDKVKNLISGNKTGKDNQGKVYSSINDDGL